MTANPNQFRLGAYLAAGGVFLALLAFVFFGFPDTGSIKPPTDKAKADKKKSSCTTGMAGRTRSGKKISGPTDRPESESGPLSSERFPF